ncbi:MAG: hypothetical protein R3B95_21355 [Nitrospirales bacterium]|nr:hypothetical protein [Nitrospirales bacterium]
MSDYKTYEKSGKQLLQGFRLSALAWSTFPYERQFEALPSFRLAWKQSGQ